MTTEVHARKPWIVQGKVAGANIGEAWCGSRSQKTDDDAKATCTKCRRLIKQRRRAS